MLEIGWFLNLKFKSSEIDYWAFWRGFPLFHKFTYFKNSQSWWWQFYKWINDRKKIFTQTLSAAIDCAVEVSLDTWLGSCYKLQTKHSVMFGNKKMWKSSDWTYLPWSSSIGLFIDLFLGFFREKSLSFIKKFIYSFDLFKSKLSWILNFYPWWAFIRVFYFYI